MTLEADYVIVGAGSAGCVLAERLSADGRTTVCLLEAGGSDNRFWIRTPIGYGKTYHDPRVNWMFETAPEAALAGRRLFQPRGKVLGGSSSINAMVYSHGMPSDYDDWRDAGNPGWGWDEVSTAFAAFERRVYDDGRVVGDGPICVSDRERELHPIKRFFYAAAAEIGLPRSADVNGPSPEGVGGYHFSTEDGRRCSAASFLRRAASRRNLAVVMNAHALGVVFDGRRAVGVDIARPDGARSRVRARREVIVSAGAYGSPQLLQLSGVGPGALLQSLGVPVVAAREGVGGALQDHLGVNYFYRATEPTLNAALGTVFGRLRAGVEYITRRRGPLSMSVNQLGGMVRSTPDKPRPDVQLYFNPLSYSITVKGPRNLMKPDPWAGFIIGHNSCRPTSVGRVDAASPDPFAPPRIQPNYLSTDQDIVDLIAAARLIGRLQEARAMRALLAAAPVFDPARATDEEIVADFRQRSGSVYHPCGTCRMAPESVGGVVDPRCRVYGVDGLRVVDASIMPNVTSANINAPTMMLAWRAAGMILADA